MLGREALEHARAHCWQPVECDGDPPHAPRGCPFQAWSLGEALRLDLAVLAE